MSVPAISNASDPFVVEDAASSEDAQSPSLRTESETRSQPENGGPVAFSFPELEPRSSTRRGVPQTGSVQVELGHATLTREEADRLKAGDVIPLDQLVDDAIDVIIDHRVAARGQLVVVDGLLGIRVEELSGADD